MIEFSDASLAAFVGLGGGALLGLAARLGRFCTLGAIEDQVYAGDGRRLRMWALALATAIMGVFIVANFGALPLQQTIYAQTHWNPWASVAGGLVFGYGMAICGNCGFGALARAGGGDIRALIILIVMGVMAFVALNGPLAGLRLALFPVETAAAEPDSLSLAHRGGALLSIPPLVVAGVVAAVLAIWALASADFRLSARHVFWSLIVGAAIILGWIGTAYIHQTGFDGEQVRSHTFTAPLGATLLYLMTSSGGGIGFAFGSVVGVALGAFLACVVKREFRWEACDDPHELRRQLFGAALMGVGGVVAMGCSIGQGLTAFSTLAPSAPVTVAAIYVGAVLGLRQLVEGVSPWRTVQDWSRRLIAK